MTTKLYSNKTGSIDGSTVKINKILKTLFRRKEASPSDLLTEKINEQLEKQRQKELFEEHWGSSVFTRYI